MSKIDSVMVFRVLKKMSTPFTQMESYKAGVIDKKGNVVVPKHKRTAEQTRAFNMMERMVVGLKRSSDPHAHVSALRMMKEYVEDNSNEETVQVLFEKMEHHKMIRPVRHDISTYEGFMDAVDEAMAEMVSGAAIGGRFDGMQTNAASNASGMAAPNGPAKKKKKIENILQRRL